MTDLQVALIIDNMFTKLENPSEPLTDWEESFIESIREQFKKKGTLSPKQREILERIYDEKTP